MCPHHLSFVCRFRLVVLLGVEPRPARHERAALPNGPKDQINGRRAAITVQFAFPCLPSFRLSGGIVFHRPAGLCSSFVGIGSPNFCCILFYPSQRRSTRRASYARLLVDPAGLEPALSSVATVANSALRGPHAPVFPGCQLRGLWSFPRGRPYRGGPGMAGMILRLPNLGLMCAPGRT